MVVMRELSRLKLRGGFSWVSSGCIDMAWTVWLYLNNIERIGHDKLWSSEGGLSESKWSVNGGKGVVRRSDQGWSECGCSLDLQEW
jgi:hypothetical protein